MTREYTPFARFIDMGADLVANFGRKGEPQTIASHQATADIDRDCVRAATHSLNDAEQVKVLLCYIAWMLERPCRKKLARIRKQFWDGDDDCRVWVKSLTPPCPPRCVDRIVHHLRLGASEAFRKVWPRNVEAFSEDWFRFRVPHPHWMPERIAGAKTKMQSAYTDWLKPFHKAGQWVLPVSTSNSRRKP